MAFKLNLISAVCSNNNGIGLNGQLPWKLKSELAYFSKMTTKCDVGGKKNAVIMGRVSWECIPGKYRPLSKRLNIILSRNMNWIQSFQKNYPNFDFENDVLLCSSFEDMFQKIAEPKWSKLIDKLWIIGGSEIYKEAMQSKYFHRLYLTEIQAEFECDTFFPEIPMEKLTLVCDDSVPKGVQIENNIKFVYKVFENIQLKN